MSARVASNIQSALLAAGIVVLMTISAAAAGRDKVEAFLNVTGFDVALDSIRLTAGSAPDMLGIDADEFGADWTRLVDDVFDTELLHTMGLEILEQTLTDELLAHGAAFYASDLGQRLVEAENTSHMIEDDVAKTKQGEAIVSELVKSGSERLESLKRMNTAIDASGNGARALQEVQFRFLMAAAAAGIVELRMDGDELRAMMQEQEGALRLALQTSALSGSAFTYRDFSDQEVDAYATALEDPDMQLVYELMNAVQYEIMANRFEVLAGRMLELHPGQEL
ncbi:MAG: DUF2059 domain-containing protein [Paracoccaceae bacterium]